ncbi:MAG TPA: nucleotidyl transferase AbiEii/AbiGii toxin family protein [Chloroflexi bacterium]|nr:nucleotidyl transferase AbiEii/AbiGii toxin family protein [Chloroflexota bacterium]
MKYQSGGAFRRALENRLRVQSLESGVALLRLRKMVTFDRFLARLMLAQPDAWMVKGGLALQLRLAARARTTKDVDVLLLTPHQDVHLLLIGAASLDVGDWFRFEVARPAGGLREDQFGGLRFHTSSLVDGRPFERFHVDVGIGDPIVELGEYLAMPALLEFADIRSTIVPCYPLTQQLAEKLHALTRPHLSGESSRVKDLVDILLIAELNGINGPLLLQAIQATFDARRTHPLPRQLPDPPPGWSTTFRRMASEVGLGYPTLAQAGPAARRFLDPILQGETWGTWDPAAWAWRSDRGEG